MDTRADSLTAHRLHLAETATGHSPHSHSQREAAAVHGLSQQDGVYALPKLGTSSYRYGTLSSVYLASPALEPRDAAGM